MRPVVTAKTFLKTIDAWREEVVELVGGARNQIYGVMAKAWFLVLLLREDERLQRKFFRHAKLKGRRKASELVTEVMAFVMSANSERKRKLAWKRGRVIEFLHGQGIKTEKIAKEIQARGGLEAVCKQAAELKPRRNTTKNASKKVSEKEPTTILGKIDRRHSTDADQSKSANAQAGAVTLKNDQYVTVELLISLSDLDDLEKMVARSKAKITVKRLSRNDVKFKVIRVKRTITKVTEKDEDNNNTW